MLIPQISNGNATLPYLDDWQVACNSMHDRIGEMLHNDSDHKLDGYLSTMMAFVNGLGPSSGAQKLQQAMGNFIQAVGKALAGRPSNWKSDLQSMTSQFPSSISPSEIKAGFVSALNYAASQIAPDPVSSPSAAGFQQSLQDLFLFGSPKTQEVLVSRNFQNPLNAFIDEPDASHQQALIAEIKSAIGNL